MENLKIQKFIVSPYSANVYIVWNKKTKEAFIVDCPAPIEKISNFIKQHVLKIKFVLITHGHFDHIDGLNNFMEEFKVPFYISEKDSEFLINPMYNGSLMVGDSVVILKKPEFLVEGQKIPFSNLEIEVIETGGHTQGGLSFKLGNWLFSGDTLFYHTVGRTDLPFADTEQLQNSIKNKLFILDKKIVVYPGHGLETSIGEEIENNPYVGKSE
ncbi:MAG: MBL fold metallo-hydrolase [Patescibacteria group bacterium]